MTTWLITGVGSGLGRALAAAALARGDQVYGTVRRQADAERFESSVPGRALALMLDLSDAAAVSAAVRRAEVESGGLDVLVNNAGYGLAGAIEEVDIDQARGQFDVNLFAPLAAIQAVLPAMRARRAGRIVNVTSVSGLATWVGTGVYCASKFALEAIGETLAAEVAPLGVKVTNVAPGGLRTDYASRSLATAAHKIDDYAPTAHQSRAILAAHAGQEPGDPDKVAAAIVGLVDLNDPPVHLLLGADALLYARRGVSALMADIDAWEPVSLSVGFADGE